VAAWSVADDSVNPGRIRRDVRTSSSTEAVGSSGAIPPECSESTRTFQIDSASFTLKRPGIMRSALIGRAATHKPSGGSIDPAYWFGRLRMADSLLLSTALARCERH
jgi:hypothetical protein